MPILLKNDDIIPIKSSTGIDDVGRVFSLKGDDKFVYRNVSENSWELYTKLTESLAQSKKLREYIIDTSISDYTNEKQELILRHRKIRYVNYPWEWSREMIKSAALMFIDLNIELIANGYFTKDSHSFNIIFDGGKPVFIDYGSIIANHNRIYKFWLEQFELFFLLPLYYFSFSVGKNYRSVYLPGRGFTRDDYKLGFKQAKKSRKILATYLGSQFRMSFLEMKLGNIKNENTQIRFLGELRKTVENIGILYPATSWSDYGNNKQFSEDSSSWDNKQRVIHDIAQKCSAETVIDLAGNNGFYLDIFARYNNQAKDLHLFDYDEVCIDHAFREKKYNTLVIDFANIGNHISSAFQGMSYELDSIDERISGDMVLALALVHHLVFWQGFTFETIAENLSHISKRYCAVEFIAKEDVYVSQWYGDKYQWYSLENFKEAMAKHFTILEIFDSNPEHRYILLCEKKADV